MIRTRFAPSPTGIPHIGNTRTALYNYLFAKHHQGEFVLRIEDTDQKRLVPESLEKIYEILKYVGITWDKGPYVQSKRLKIYHKYAQQLLKSGAAFKDQKTIRLNIPSNQDIAWKDLIQGSISINSDQLHQAVLIKSDGFPTYHFAVVVDDHLMKISHILRGVEWISSTPLHILLYKAFNWAPPKFGHFSIILGPDKSKLSKRHGAKSILDYQAAGYLPDALLTFMSYLGWSYQDNSSLLNLKKLTKLFDLNKVQQQNSIFDKNKLDFFNGLAIRNTPDQKLISLLKTHIPKNCSQSQVKQILPLIKKRLITLSDFKSLSQFFYSSIKLDKKLLFAQSNKSKDQLSIAMQTTIKAYQQVDEKQWLAKHLEATGRALLETTKWSPKDLFMTIRVATTGQTATPPLFDTLEVLGKEKTIKRLTHASTI